MAGMEAEETKREVEYVARSIDDLWSEMLQRWNRSPVEVFWQLRHERQRVWAAFCIDRVQRPSRAADRVAVQLKAALEEPIRLEEAVRNEVELQAWKRFFDEENSPASAAWWRRALAEVMRAGAEAVIPVHLPDWTDDIVKLLAEGVLPVDMQIEPWPE